MGENERDVSRAKSVEEAVKCKGFCANECVTGYCPIALGRAYDEYSDMGYPIPKNCKECWFNTYRCEDCIFYKTEDCVRKED